MHTQTRMAAPPAAVLEARNAKRYILAALMATLGLATVVTAFFIMLCPAHINFSVTHTGSHPSGDGGVLLILTLAANNTSSRTAVKYLSIFVDVKNSTGPETGYSVKADLTTDMPLSQRPASVANVNARASLVDTPWTEGFTGNKTCNTFAVIVAAVARFKVGIARTRLYDIKVSCGPVSFFPAAADHSGAPAPAGLLPVNCV
uniref:Late embryogenesis abundant protein LEA-2 subgroup domain-containing protein n=1 Tax=Arundo donax TaxID=35708 RepID=A0A0A8XPG7_ARUDO